MRKLFWKVAAGAVFACASLHVAAQGHVPGRVLVKFKDGISMARSAAQVQQMGGRQVGKIAGLGVDVVTVAANGNESAIAKRLGSLRDVEFAELDLYAYPSEIVPNDPWYYYGQPFLKTVKAPAAWEYTTGSSSVTVGVVDSGVFGSHEDLVENMVPGANLVSKNGSTNDILGHGTAVAGVIAARGNNAVGVASLAWNSRIMPLQVFDATGKTSMSAVASAITYAADHGVKVVNASLAPLHDSSTIASAAHYLAGKGGVLVVSAGNYGSAITGSDNPEIVVVSATNTLDQFDTTSAYGTPIDICAPGAARTTTWDGQYGGFGGTSCSAPVVSGVLALMFAENPSLSSSEAIRMLLQSADDLGSPGWDPYYGWGRVNASSAVVAAMGNTVVKDTTAPVVNFQNPGSGQNVAGQIQIAASATDDKGVASVQFYVGGILAGTVSASPYSANWDTRSWTNGPVTLTALATDTSGNTASSLITVFVNNVADWLAPSVGIASPSNGSKIKGSLKVALTASDDVGVTSTELYADGTLVQSSSSGSLNFSVNTRKWSRGAHTLVARAYDATGKWGESVPVTIYL